jgi:hypothetical protein
MAVSEIFPAAVGYVQIQPSEHFIQRARCHLGIAAITAQGYSLRDNIWGHRKFSNSVIRLIKSTVLMKCDYTKKT